MAAEKGNKYAAKQTPRRYNAQMSLADKRQEFYIQMAQEILGIANPTQSEVESVARAHLYAYIDLCIATK